MGIYSIYAHACVCICIYRNKLGEIDIDNVDRQDNENIKNIPKMASENTLQSTFSRWYQHS